ncbi:hypothetical protein [Deinococcus sp. QL22]|uniref:hypothetical protein n=1 Tax=Deinococcus sp. QL22 TaxID=2939437 RepID=UPI00201807D9|nr:hypothetical protein [Deinococcus sp. QL22]UQN06232.1 hypothetical protein M1R55_15435 [Deinococcus sp. QL22]
MSKPTPPPVRTITDAQRKSTFRTFLWILGGFIATIGLLVATFSFQGRAARDYGSRAVQAALASQPSPSISYEQPCADLLNMPLPDTVEKCVIRVVSGAPEAILDVEGGRQYRMTK